MNAEPADTPDTAPAESSDPTSPADFDLAARLWLRAATPLLAARSHDSDPSPRVQFAIDLMFVSLCERVARICRSDLPADPH